MRVVDSLVSFTDFCILLFIERFMASLIHTFTCPRPTSITRRELCIEKLFGQVLTFFRECSIAPRRSAYLTGEFEPRTGNLVLSFTFFIILVFLREKKHQH